MFIPPGYANITWEFQHVATAQVAMTSMGVQLEAADPQDVADGAAAAWLENIGTNVSEEWTNGVVRLTIATSDPSAPIVVEIPYDDLNGNTNDPAPPQVAWLIRKFTLSGGRKGRGRMFIPGVLEAGIDGAGLFSTSQHDVQVADANAFLSALQAIDGVTSTYLFHTDPLDEPSEVLGLVSERMVATQRRRLRG